jgi:hypothetical protein
MIAGPGEIVVGTATLEALHKHIGDSVTNSNGDTLRIVGSATFPTIGQVHGDHTSLGIGGIVVKEQTPGYDRNRPELQPGEDPEAAAAAYGANVIFVRFNEGVDDAAVLERVTRYSEDIADYNSIQMTPVQRSAEVVNANDITGSSTMLGAAVAAAALASLAVALTSAVRRRRRDLALLKTLGFTRRQLSATVAAQSTATIGIGLAMGIPLGIVAGRQLWSRFASQLDVLAEPAVPVLVIIAVAVGAVFAANVLSALPARVARRVPAGLSLRAE